MSILSGLEGVELRGRVIFYADCLPVPVPVPMASAAHASGAELPTARCRWDLGPLCACASGRGRLRAVHVVMWIHMAPARRYLSASAPAGLDAGRAHRRNLPSCGMRDCVSRERGRLVFASTYLLATIPAKWV